MKQRTLALLAAAKQAVADFSVVQPEADLDKLLWTEGFPKGQLLAEGLGMVWSVWYVPQAIRTSLSLLIAEQLPCLRRGAQMDLRGQHAQNGPGPGVAPLSVGNHLAFVDDGHVVVPPHVQLLGGGGARRTFW